MGVPLPFRDFSVRRNLVHAVCDWHCDGGLAANSSEDRYAHAIGAPQANVGAGIDGPVRESVHERTWESTGLVARTVFKTAEVGSRRLVGSIPTPSRHVPSLVRARRAVFTVA